MAEIPNLVIAVCTRKRRELLLRLLKSIWAQPRPDLFKTSVLIIDNNDTPTVTIADLGLADTFPLIIKHQPQTGLVHARNMVLDVAENMQAEWVICVDDDEWVAEDWLESFVSGIQTIEADMLVGRTNVIHDDTQLFVPHKKKRDIIPGAKNKQLTSSNLALRNSVFDKTQGAGLRFDTRFNESGSEDTEFMLRARRVHGLSILNWPKAEVYEEWFGSRASLWYRLKRRAKFQQNTFRISALHRQAGYLNDRHSLWVRILRHVNRSAVFGTAKLIKGTLTLFANRAQGLSDIEAGLKHWADVVAVIPFLFGKRPSSYGMNSDERR